MNARNPHDLVQLTLNHLDAMLDYARTPAVKQNVELAYELLIQSYCSLNTAQMQVGRNDVDIEALQVNPGPLVLLDLQIYPVRTIYLATYRTC